MTLNQMFSDFIKAKNLFVNRDVLSISFKPEQISHREKEIEALGKIVAPALLGSKPNNIFIYGRCGTGKTLASLYVTSELMKNVNGSKIKTIYLNCKMNINTKYRLLARIIKEFGKEIPFTGLPTDQVYNMFFETIDKEKQTIILIIDEIDSLIEKTGDEILYTLTRINQELKNAKISIIGITNKLDFIDRLDPRVKSSLSEEELIFPPYNAVQLKEILKQRAELAFSKNVLEDGIIEKCAALAAQEHGDARKALDLLRVSGEIAERTGSPKIKIEHVDVAEERIDMDKILEIIKTQPKQSQIVLYTILNLLENEKEIQTGDIFNKYHEMCKQSGLKSLTQRRISDLIAELDLFGIINTRVVSLGRYGRTRTISINLSDNIIKKIEKILNEIFY